MNGLPWDWWNTTTGTAITSFDHYKELMMKEDESPFASKHVFIDYFMKECGYCYDF